MSLDFSSYLNRETACSCGRTHRCGIDTVLIEDGALSRVPALLQSYGCARVCLVQDLHTRAAVGGRLAQILQEADVPFDTVTLQADGLLPDERGIGALLTRLPAECDLLLAAGSGTINDLCRFVSYKKGVPYLIAASAPSMDGFTSGVSAMITDHTKTTYEAQRPRAVIGDLSVLAEAPMELIAAGVGDIIGKYVCLADWKISSLVTGEYFCPEVERLVRRSIERVREACRGGIQSRSRESIAGLMEGLVLSGIAMSYIGNSRPASGSEHHLSHYWEMMFLQHGEHGAFHGTKVGVGTVVSLRLYEMLAQLEKTGQTPQTAGCARRFDRSVWDEEIREAYGIAAPAVLALEDEVHKNSPEQTAARLAALREHREEVRQIIEALPPAAEIRALLASLDAPCLPAQLSVDAPMLRRSILYAKDLRCRYGLLQLLYDARLSEPFAQALIRELYGAASPAGKERA